MNSPRPRPPNRDFRQGDLVVYSKEVRSSDLTSDGKRFYTYLWRREDDGSHGFGSVLFVDINAHAILITKMMDVEAYEEHDVAVGHDAWIVWIDGRFYVTFETGMVHAYEEQWLNRSTG